MKRIITCSDGTWNKPGITDRGSVVKTNVEKIYDGLAALTAPARAARLNVDLLCNE